MKNRLFFRYPMHTVICFVVLLSRGCREISPIEDAVPPQLDGPQVLVGVGSLRSPRGIAIDPSGDVWVADTYGNRIQRYAPNGAIRSSIHGFQLPSSMGVDRGTNSILAITNGTTVVGLHPLTEDVTTVATLTNASIDASNVFDVVARQSESRLISIDAVGDLDGNPNGDIYLSVLANTNENYLMRITSGQVTAVAFSQVQPFDSTRTGARFVGSDEFNSVYTAFLVPNQQSLGVLQPYMFNPGNVLSSRTFNVPELSSGPTGACTDRSGLLYVADATFGALLVISTSSGRAVEILDMPAISGMIQPVPWDVATAPDGTVYVAVIDLMDPAHQSGAVLKYLRNAR